MYDYVVIGTGIVGSLVARELSKYELNICVIDKENDVANVQTRANSAIVHSGHDPKHGTLKAKLAVWGNELYDELEHELKISLLRTGAYVCARGKDEEAVLDEIFHNAIKNQVALCQILSYEEAVLNEPNLDPSITKVLSLPTTKVCFPWEVAFHALENAIEHGVELRLNSLVEKITFKNSVYTIYLKNLKPIKTHHIINAAGIYADHIAKMVNPSINFKIYPKKGEYFVLDKSVQGFAHHVLYPIPDHKGKGVLVTPQVHGNILLGPTSEPIDDKDDLSTSLKGLTYIKEQVNKLLNNIPYHLIIRSFSGVRSTSDYEDFYIKEDQLYRGFYHLAGIDSPGITAAPAIAKYLVEDIIKIDQPIKKTYTPHSHKKIVFKDLNEKDRVTYQKEKPLYGRIICKCEGITEQEIIDAIHGPLGSHTIKGIKKRVRCGSGLCQGGYCESLVLKIISKQTGKNLNDICYDQIDTPILYQETKVTKK